jgi:hypothetical protein
VLVLVTALVVVVVALVLALPVLDREARQRATTLVEAQVQRELGLAEPPTVVVGGRWFLWQALRGRYGTVTTDAPALTHQGTTVQRPRVQLRDVRVPHSVLLGRGGTVEVASGTARAVVPWPVLEERARAASGTGVALSADGSDVRAATTVTVLRRQVDLSLTATPRVEGRSIVLRPERVSLGGREVAVDDVRRLLAGAGLTALLDGVRIGLDEVAGLPAGVQLRGLQVVPEGLVVQADLAAMALPVPTR